MLSTLVRPLVDTQIRLLANSKKTDKTIAQTIVTWLGYIGVRTEVTQLIPNSDRISVSLTVGKPESCTEKDWQKILDNLLNSHADEPSDRSEEIEMAKLVQLSRLLAYVIQAGSSETQANWNILEKNLAPLNLDSVTLGAVRSALKVPQSINALDQLDPDLAARAFPLAVKIAWMDNQITAEESEALKALLSLIAPDMKI
ncbi:hypothetical protein DO97_17680 [Neosynechococcus sphagnicola sy1]|uniref:Uncharacterized protein n=1 Tax=Neosynechococcus sphagnicola sy1 TaxID=1497020 RepID=A0A098THP0_9CYAN|nr:hypothetical protein [Neosynechococcus sphagnicola]KGF71556.1 hypothetical protein DO97_17680 [Neosynechococcus sphagnicola sy1]